ncbi:MAG: hypothetical protein ACRDT8_22170 [Micromonosporaceae bacterium]
MLLAVIALIELIDAGVRVVFALGRGSGELGLILAAQNSLIALIVVGVALLAAVLVVSGKDAGRPLGFAVSGYEALGGFSSVTVQAVFLFTGHGTYRDIAFIVGAVLSCVLATVVFFLLLNRSVVDWTGRQQPGR